MTSTKYLSTQLLPIDVKRAHVLLENHLCEFVVPVEPVSGIVETQDLTSRSVSYNISCLLAEVLAHVGHLFVHS